MVDMAISEGEIAALVVAVRRHAGAPPLLSSPFVGGHIAAEPSGTEGFGYDPVFIPEGEERTVAELGDTWKALNSHRARAAQALLHALASAPATTS